MVCLTVLMVRCIDGKDKKKKRHIEGEGGGKLGIEAEHESGAAESVETRQDQRVKGCVWREWLGYYHLLSLLPPALRSSRHIQSPHHHHNLNHQGQGHSEISQQHQQAPRHQQPGRMWDGIISSSIPSPWSFTFASASPRHLSSPPAAAAAAARTRTRLFLSKLWTKRHNRRPHRYQAELPEECVSPATTPGAVVVLGCENLTPTPKTGPPRFGQHGSHHQIETVCELPAEVPEGVSKEVLMRRKRRSFQADDVVPGGLKDDIKDYDCEGQRARRGRTTLPLQLPLPLPLPPCTSNHGDGDDRQQDNEYLPVATTKPHSSSPCPSQESGPLGTMEVLEKSMDLERSPGGFI